MTLADCAPGPVRLVRISEQAQADDAAIAFMAQLELLPGCKVEVLPTPDGTAEGRAIRTAQGVNVVPAWISALIWVTVGRP